MLSILSVFLTHCSGTFSGWLLSHFLFFRTSNLYIKWKASLNYHSIETLVLNQDRFFFFHLGNNCSRISFHIIWLYPRTKLNNVWNDTTKSSAKTHKITNVKYSMKHYGPWQKIIKMWFIRRDNNQGKQK